MAEILDSDSKSDNELVRLTLENQEYFLYLMRRYEQKILRYIMRISNVDDDSAHDLLQEIFIKTYQHLHSFDQRLKFSSWLYRIAHNHVISYFRKTANRDKPVSLEVNEEIIETLADDFDITQAIDREFLKQHLTRLMSQLDEKYREAIILRYFEEKDYKEISDIIKRPTATVGTLLNRAKLQSKQLLKSHEFRK